MRTRYGNFPEYHTSADNLEFVKKESLSDSFLKYLSVIFTIENNKTYNTKSAEHDARQHSQKSKGTYYINLNPKCEPHLSKYDLYKSIGDGSNDEYKKSLLWILNFSDGNTSLLDISNKSGIKFELIKKSAGLLVDKNLIKQI